MAPNVGQKLTSPTDGGCQRLINRLEQEVIQPGVAHRPVVTLDTGILLRVSRLDLINQKPSCSAQRRNTGRHEIRPN